MQYKADRPRRQGRPIKRWIDQLDCDAGRAGILIGEWRRRTGLVDCSAGNVCIYVIILVLLDRFKIGLVSRHVTKSGLFFQLFVRLMWKLRPWFIHQFFWRYHLLWSRIAKDSLTLTKQSNCVQASPALFCSCHILKDSLSYLRPVLCVLQMMALTHLTIPKIEQPPGPNIR